MIAADGRFSLIQVYTIARQPGESYVGPLSDSEVDRIAATVGRETGLPAAAFYGSGR